MTPLDWRKLESEIIAFVREEGLYISQGNSGDTYIQALDPNDLVGDFSLSSLARRLADRCVSAKVDP